MPPKNYIQPWHSPGKYAIIKWNKYGGAEAPSPAAPIPGGSPVDSQEE